MNEGLGELRCRRHFLAFIQENVIKKCQLCGGKCKRIRQSAQNVVKNTTQGGG